MQKKFEKERHEAFDLIKIKNAEIEKEQQLNNFLKDSENPKSNNADIDDLPEKVRCIVSEELSKFTENFKTMTEEKTNVDKRSDNGNSDRETEICCTEFLGGKGYVIRRIDADSHTIFKKGSLQI